MRRKMLITFLPLTVAFIVPLFFASLITPTFGSSPTNTTFNLNIIVENAVGLYGLDLKLFYTTATLDLVEAIPHPPWGFNVIVKNEIDDSNGIYKLVMAALAPESPFTGSITVATLTFQITNYGENSIYLVEAKLVDKNGGLIPNDLDGCTIRCLPQHDVAVNKVLGYPRSAYQGDPISFDVDVENQGDFAETFTVTLYADRDRNVIGDEIVIGTQTVYDMPPRTSKKLNLVWDTTDAPYGGYWISAKLSEVPGEIDISDNFLKESEYIGGIYPKPYVRQAAEFWAQILSACIFALVASGGLFYIKNYWFG